MRRVEAKAANARVREQTQFLRPPLGQMMRRLAIAEPCLRDIALTGRATRIEPRIRALERLEPMLVVLIKTAFGTDAVDHDIDEQGQLVLRGDIGELAQTVRRARVGFKNSVKLMMIGNCLAMPVASGRERRADQNVIEAQRRCVLELSWPVRQGADEKGIDEVDTRRIRMMSLMVFHRSSFQSRPAVAGMRALNRDHAHGPNWQRVGPYITTRVVCARVTGQDVSTHG